MQFGEKVHVSHQQCEHFGLHCVQCVQYVSAIIIIHCSYAQLEWPFCHIKMCSAHSQWSCLHGKEEDPTDCELCHTDQQIYTQRGRINRHLLYGVQSIKKRTKNRLNMKVRKEIWSANFKSSSYGDMIGAVIYQTHVLELTRGADCIFEWWQAVSVKLAVFVYLYISVFLYLCYILVAPAVKQATYLLRDRKSPDHRARAKWPVTWWLSLRIMPRRTKWLEMTIGRTLMRRAQQSHVLKVELNSYAALRGTK